MTDLPFPPLTLVVAATHVSLGIGRAGRLPWRLPTDMAFFRLLTSAGTKPAVVMGRKSWESIPTRFRPLKDRVNIVLSRNTADFGPGTLTFASLPHALTALSTPASTPDSTPPVSAVYIIGGAEIYRDALAHPATTRVILTTIYPPSAPTSNATPSVDPSNDNCTHCDQLATTLGCDTFLPDFRTDSEWHRQPPTRLRALLTEMNCLEALALVPPDGERVAENGFEYEFALWERSRPTGSDRS
ncbi:dihydrofolate reductase-like domain-containing protein [Limtongia smithiae]|uniref:dihydrofolate reductase-like domain-containing protein n=1 Tax=Limtongia smithiae TaxID=1125753 RepID=UPI0034CE3A4B